jgi:hypothetical protein
MNANLRRCLATVNLYYAGHYHTEIDKGSNLKLCSSLIDVIASYILPHNEYLCFIACYVAKFYDVNISEEKNNYIIPKENIDLKTVIYNKELHSRLVKFCDINNLDHIENFCFHHAKFYSQKFLSKWMMYEYDVEKEAWKLPNIDINIDSLFFDNINTLQIFNATVDTNDGKIDKEYYERAKHLKETLNKLCEYHTTRFGVNQTSEVDTRYGVNQTSEVFNNPKDCSLHQLREIYSFKAKNVLNFRRKKYYG